MSKKTDGFKNWVYENRKGIIIAGLVLLAAGTAAIIVINGKKVKVPLKMAVEVVPGLSEAAVEVADTITVNIDNVVKTFPRASFIRHLPLNWKASAEKIAQAASLGIDLNPGETFVRACTVTMKTAA